MGKSKRIRAAKPVPPKAPHDKQKNSATTIHQQTMESQFHGPIPPPNILAEYEKLLPGAADRILAMAESETAHRQMMEGKAVNAEIDGLKSEATDTRIGQIFGLVIGLTTVLAGAYTAVNGAQITGALIGTSGVVGLVSAFIVGRKNNQPVNGKQKNQEVSPPQEK